MAIGSPFGLAGSLSTGIVSGTDRVLVGGGAVQTGMLQTTATFNPGDTGGPVCDSSGRLVGMVFSTYGRSPRGLSDRVEEEIGWLERNRDQISALGTRASKLWQRLLGSDSPGGAAEDEDGGVDPASATEAATEAVVDRLQSMLDSMAEVQRQILGERGDFLGAQGISFILPTEQIEWVADQLIESGRVRRGWLGVVATSTAGDPGGGARLHRVEAGSPAAEAGLVVGDVVRTVGEVEVERPDDLHARIAFSRPGDELVLGIEREGADGRVEIRVVLGERPGDR
jgi:S1-C subfamily serine protease